LNLTLFDLDGTLLPIDSDHAFGEFMIELGWADAKSYRQGNDAFYVDYQMGRLDIDAYVEFCTAPWRERSLVEQEAARQRFVEQVARPALSPRALALVQGHRQSGDLLAIVTATNEFVTRPFAALFGIETLIATELQTDAVGQATGRIRGTAAFRDGKIARVEQWLAGLGRRLADFERSTFYSDSSNDLPLLEHVSHPVATNPGPALHAIAQQRGWPVLNLFT
jgi:HAD superfamily hydrolase (TIGR01490 family)